VGAAELQQPHGRAAERNTVHRPAGAAARRQPQLVPVQQAGKRRVVPAALRPLLQAELCQRTQVCGGGQRMRGQRRLQPLLLRVVSQHNCQGQLRLRCQLLVVLGWACWLPLLHILQLLGSCLQCAAVTALEAHHHQQGCCGHHC
jgi:hypothetical protein